jgi:endonuclease/exonuclease/phosphatase (EEP) superfamily protein YafD
MKIKKIILILLYLLLIGVALPFLLGFVNGLHPLFDSFTNFRVHLLIILIPLTLLITFFHQKPYSYLYLFTTILLGATLYFITQPFTPKPLDSTKRYTLKFMQFNLSFRNQQLDEFKAYIKKNPVDIITLQEVTSAHQESLEMLKTDGFGMSIKKEYPFIERTKGAYPYQYYCAFRGVGGGAILSKHPINLKKRLCIEGQGLLWAEVEVEKQPITVASIHLFWPFPYEQPKQLSLLKSPLESMPKNPTLISGDFNAVAWSHAVNQVAKASNTKVVEGLRWSITLKEQLPLLPFIKLSIDHILLSKAFQVKSIDIKEDLGSDHSPVVAEIGY